MSRARRQRALAVTTGNPSMVVRCHPATSSIWWTVTPGSRWCAPWGAVSVSGSSANPRAAVDERAGLVRHDGSSPGGQHRGPQRLRASGRRPRQHVDAGVGTVPDAACDAAADRGLAHPALAGLGPGEGTALAAGDEVDPGVERSGLHRHSMATACDNEAGIPPDGTSVPEAMSSDLARMRHEFRMWNRLPRAPGDGTYCLASPASPPDRLGRAPGYRRRRSLAMWVIWISSVPA